MIVVIIAGGSGTRLWPLSTPSYPKHLLQLTSERTLVQQTVDRVRNLTDCDKIFVVSEKSHIEHIYEQLPEIPRENILCEPGRRETANCLIFALSVIKKRGFADDEPIATFWADQIIENHEGFTETIIAAGRLAAEHRKLVNVGIRPRYPSTGFGYIKCGKRLEDPFEAYALDGFREKPDVETAMHYIESGEYFWNSGYLVGALADTERDIKKYGPELWRNYEFLNAAADIDEAYLSLDKLNLEYNFREHNPDMLVVAGDFDWTDVGSHGDLHSISVQDDNGNVIGGGNISIESASNSLVRNHTDIPVAVIGVDDIVVIATEHGILVASKHASQKVGDIAKQIHRQQTQA